MTKLSNFHQGLEKFVSPLTEGVINGGKFSLKDRNLDKEAKVKAVFHIIGLVFLNIIAIAAFSLLCILRANLSKIFGNDPGTAPGTLPPKLNQQQIQEAIENISVELDVDSTAIYPPEKPETRVMDRKQASNWINAHKNNDNTTNNTIDVAIATKFIETTRIISHDEFIGQLEQSVESFNKRLLELPADERKFAIILPPNYQQSNVWVTLLALPFLRYSDFKIVLTWKWVNFIKTNPTYNHAVYFDDASYSGSQLLNQYEVQADKISYVVPFVGKRAEDSIKKLVSEGSEKWVSDFDRLVPFFDHLNDAQKTRMKVLCPYGYGPEPRVPPTHPNVVFDHKIADGISVQSDQLESGVTFNKATSSTFPFLSNAKPPYKKIRLN